jgi:hypothetical protein
MWVSLTRCMDALTAGYTQLFARSAETAHHSWRFALCGRLVGFVRQAVRQQASGPRAAKVAELADAPDLGSGSRKAVGVQVPPFAPDIFAPHLFSVA